jgi:hypothetical protein
MDGDINCKVASVRVAGNDTACAKVATMEEDGDTTMRGKGLGCWVTVLGGPEGLSGPVSGPRYFLLYGGTVCFKTGKHITCRMAQVRLTEGIVTEATYIM